MSVLFRGKDGWDQFKAERRQQELRKKTGKKPRWFLATDSEGKLTFLDTPDAFFYEHTIRLGNDFLHLTCLKGRNGKGECPACEFDKTRKPALVLASTIISHKGYVTRDGREVKHQKQLLVLKGSALDAIKRKIERAPDNDLRYHRFTVARGSNPKSVGTGDDFELDKKVKVAYLVKLKPADSTETDREWLTPFDYEAEFGAMSEKEMRKLLGMEDPIGYDDVDDDEEDDDDDVTDDTDTDSDDDDDDVETEVKSKTSDDDVKFDDDVPFDDEDTEEEEPEPKQKPKAKKKRPANLEDMLKD